MDSMSCMACLTFFVLPLTMNEVSSLHSILFISTPVVSFMLMMVAPFLPITLAAACLLAVIISVVISAGSSLLVDGLGGEGVSLFVSCTVILSDSSSYSISRSLFGGGIMCSWVMMLLNIMQAPSVRCIPSWAMRLLSVSISSMLIVLCCCASLSRPSWESCTTPNHWVIGGIAPGHRPQACIVAWEITVQIGQQM